MQLDRLEHYDKFSDGKYLFWMDISDLPQNIQVQAREIAKENYSPKYFGACVGYDRGTDEFYLVTDWEKSDAPCTVYYVDVDGDKRWFPCEISPEFLELIFTECKKVLAQENEAQKPSVRDALRKIANESIAHPAPRNKSNEAR